MNEELEKLRELTKTITRNGYLSNQTQAWQYAFDSVNELVCITNLNFQIKFINKPLSKKFNIDPSDCINKKINTIITKELFPEICCKEKEIDPEPTLHYEAIYIEEYSSWYERSRHLITSNSGKLIGYTFMLSDITIRKVAEDNLIESERQYKKLFNNMDSGVALHEVIYDEGGNPIDYMFVKVNPAFEVLTGLKEKDIIGKVVTKVLPDLEQQWFDMYFEVTKTGKTATFVQEATEIDKVYSGTAFRVHPDQFACVFSDITEQKKLDAALKRSRDLLGEILDVIPDIITAQDANGVITNVNKTAKEFFKLTSEDIGKIKCYQLIGRTDPCIECQTAICKIEKNITIKERYIEELNGWFDCRSYPILDSKGNIIRIIEHLRKLDK